MNPRLPLVYVTGTINNGLDGGSATRLDIATIAYRLSDGAVVWARRFNGDGRDGKYRCLPRLSTGKQHGQ
jgi:hypothetical protein